MNVTEILDKHRIHWTTAHKDVRQGWVAISSGCPWCGRSRGEAYLAINTRSGVANCWRCGAHSLADVLAAVGHIPLGQAIEAAKGFARPRGPAQRRTGTFTALPGVAPLLPAHRAYLRKRRFDPAQLVQLWDIAGTGIVARLPWRIYIPIHDVTGEVVSWVTRAIGDEAQPRYKGADPEEESLSAKEVLYGEFYCRHACIVHEGPTDVWATGPGAVAGLGLGITDAQVNRIASYSVRVICYDSEPEAQRRAGELAERLAPFPGRTERVELETGNDPASADPAEIAEMRAMYLGDFAPIG